MMNVESTLMMAAYNRWMNDKLYAVCAGMPDDERKLDRGSFFGSIHGTLNHLLLADRIWLGRFTGKQFHVDGLDQELYADFDELRAERSKTDDDLDCWVASLTDEALRAPFEFRSITNPEPRTMSLWVCVMHLFNHQTHHRGQLTTLLAQAGQDYGVTDLLWLPA
jgi:uncharacterized damage-inducible protein DinB